MNNNNPIPIKASEPEKTTHHAPGPPVVVHVADEQRVQGVQVPAEHGELVPDGAVLLVALRLALHAEVVLLSHHLARALLQLLHGGDEVGLEHLWLRPANDGLGEH